MQIRRRCFTPSGQMRWRDSYSPQNHGLFVALSPALSRRLPEYLLKKWVSHCQPGSTPSPPPALPSSWPFTVGRNRATVEGHLPFLITHPLLEGKPACRANSPAASTNVAALGGEGSSLQHSPVDSDSFRWSLPAVLWGELSHGTDRSPFPDAQIEASW